MGTRENLPAVVSLAVRSLLAPVSLASQQRNLRGGSEDRVLSAEGGNQHNEDEREADAEAWAEILQAARKGIVRMRSPYDK